MSVHRMARISQAKAEKRLAPWRASRKGWNRLAPLSQDKAEERLGTISNKTLPRLSQAKAEKRPSLRACVLRGL